MTGKRILSLDVLRGMTIVGMIIVNNPGSWANIFAPLRHAEWNGCTPTDLVFPFFIFCMGTAMYLSYRKFDFRLTLRTAWHTIYRGALILLIGWALSWFGMALSHLCAGDGVYYSLVQFPIDHMRYMGVFPRLGIVSALAGLLLLLCKPKGIPFVAAALLIGYCILQSVTDSFELDADNVVARVDVALMGEQHMYHKGGIAFDPEGLLSTIPCIAHCLIGAIFGSLLMSSGQQEVRIYRVQLLGAVMLFMGFLLDYAYPINKSMWSASYVFLTCGLAALLLGVFTWLIDLRGFHRWSVFFESFGVNPLLMFCCSAILVYIMRVIRFTINETTYNVWGAWYNLIMQPWLGDKWGSLACAVSLVLILWAIAWPLYRKQIYIRI